MISYIKGKIIHKNQEAIIVENAGIGYQIFVKTTKQIGDQVEYFTYLSVGSDNQPSLLGFSSPEELKLFQKFLKVPGVGPKTSQSILQAQELVSIQNAILEGDVNFFTRVKGLGKKTAQKIILELKDTLVEPDESWSEKERTIQEALISLGFTKKEIARSLKDLDISQLKEEKAIEKLLQELGK